MNIHSEPMPETSQAKQTLTPAGENLCGSRESAKGVLKNRIRQLRIEMERLQILHDLLPTCLTAEQDEAIWNLFVRNNSGL